ncbi:hypothetical protein [Paenibacillus sp. USDA918EY]|uniref:hypothetical protein n=1 Tax=Paenibacillus sp. USDA918EY TaxID=2689575 RepID=UPI00135C5C6E|nr:hypothetical protein [Paenibacillus sp. USDA918EY]
MANRYANLQGSKKISEDFNNINIGFDRVQEDMDKKASADNPVFTGTPTAPTQPAGDNSNKLATTKYADRAAGTVQTNLDKHTADKVVHVTQADHDKLGGIQEGAEVNQNAFAKVNDIAAADPSSQFFIVGGVGITVTTNPNTGEVTITATGQAAPGAHGPTHTEHGADPIPAATLTEGGLLSAAQFAEIVAHGELLDEHSAAITALEDRLDTAESETLTLQPGVQIVTAKRDARFKLGSIKGKTEINGQGRIGIIGVENPYVTRISGNLLPPFYEWNLHPNATLISPYKLSLKASASWEASSITITLIENQSYKLKLDKENGLYVKVADLKGNVIKEGYYATTGEISFTTATGINKVVVTFMSATTGTFTFENPMLTISTKSMPFTPREDVMLAFQTELHANPTDGSESDELFERDGQYYKLAKWKKVVLDGSFNWQFGAAFTGFKRITIVTSFKDALETSNNRVVKFDGKVVTRDVNVNLPDTFNLDKNGTFHILIPNSDSGWGDNYTPTPDEIKAYFMGYKMYSGTPETPYNGSGTKSFGARQPNGNVYWVQDTTPPNTVNAALPSYSLLYKLASPVVEPVTSEGCLTLTEGDNQIEVGTGIILREGTHPKLSALYNTYEINSLSPGNVASNPLKYKAEKILSVYKYNRPDKWSRISDTNSYGKERAFLDASLFDQTAAYSVTYTKIDKSPVVPITGSLAVNEKAQLTDLMTGVQEALQRVSVAEMKKAEKDAPGWITPTLLNGALPGTTPVEYKKKNGFVIIRGVYTSKAGSILLFKLPVGYRPKYVVRYGQMGVTGGQLVQSNIEIYPNGDVGVGYIGTDYMVLDGIIFEAEQ